MKFVYLVGGVGITVKHWAEPPDEPEERGTRVEVQVLREVPGTVFWAAESRSLEEPLFRADLFTRIDGALGNWDACHYHPSFVKDWLPAPREWDPALTADPRAWIHDKLCDIRQILAAGGGTHLVSDSDQEELTQAMPLVMSAIEACLSAPAAS